MKRRLVLVEWLDAQGGGGWIGLGEMRSTVQPAVIRSVGWLLPTPLDGHVSIAQSIHGDHCDSTLHVPSGMVRSVTALTRKKVK